MTVHLDTSV